MRSTVLSFLLLSLWGGAAALAAWVVCRLLRRAHAPSRFLCWLWLAVGLRFVLPFGIPLALPRPQNTQLAEAADTVQALTQPELTAPDLPAMVPASPAAPAPWYTTLTVWHLLAAVWAVGVALLAVRAVWGYLRLSRQVALACKTPDGCFSGPCVPAPFTLGLLRPRIYLPFGLDRGSRDYVLAHERTHIRHRDHWVKPLAFLLLAVNWFNPVLWAAYVLLCRDIELACDERVVRDMNRAQRAAYSQALLDCAMPRRRRLVLCPLAFGEVGVRDRVKSVLHYRRPGVWLSAAAVLLCAALAMTFLTEPKPARTGVSPEAASGQTDPDRLQEVSSKVLIVSSTLDPAAQRISYTVQLTEEPEDWIAQKQWYGVASYADVEIFYPEAGSYYRQTDVPHLRFYEWGLADQPTDLESQRPDTGTRYNDYIVDSVTVLSVDGVQHSTFRRVGQSLLLEEDTHYSGGSVSFHAWLQ